MKFIIAACAVFSIVLGVSACDTKSPPTSKPGQEMPAAVSSSKPGLEKPATVSSSKPGREKPAAASSFNPATTKLAVIPSDYELRDVFFSPDGQSVAFILRKNGKAFLSINGKISAPYEDVRDLIFRNGHGGYAVVAAQKNEKASVLVDGQEGVLYDGMDKPIAAPDGRIVYQARRNEDWYIVSDKQESAPQKEYSPVLVVSTVGKVSYVERDSTAKKSRLCVCVMDLSHCVKGKEYDSITSSESDSSLSHLVYVVSRDGKVSVVTADLGQSGLVEREGSLYDKVLNVGLSPGGEHSAFLVRRGKNTLLVKDGIESPASAFDRYLDLVVSENGRTLYSGAVKDRVVAIADGRRLDKGYGEIYSPAFSAGGGHYVFVAGIGSVNFIVVDGVEGPRFDKVVNPHFSPDGSRLVYRARRKGERFVVVADLKGKTLRELPHYESIWDIAFSPDGKSIGYGVKIRQELWWKVEKL